MKTIYFQYWQWLWSFFHDFSISGQPIRPNSPPIQPSPPIIPAPPVQPSPPIIPAPPLQPSPPVQPAPAVPTAASPNAAHNTSATFTTTHHAICSSAAADHAGSAHATANAAPVSAVTTQSAGTNRAQQSASFSLNCNAIQKMNDDVSQLLRHNINSADSLPAKSSRAAAVEHAMVEAQGEIRLPSPARIVLSLSLSQCGRRRPRAQP